jgi:predicted O-linked N-acetylglucosamine transferase (SPINDLY family)
MSNQKLEAGLALHRQGKLLEAGRIYEEVLEQDPRQFDALHLLGVISYQTGRTEQAVQLISKAISIDEAVADAHSNLGNALRLLGRFEESVASHDRAVLLQPNDAEAYYNRGNALHQAGRLDEAITSYDRALSLRPRYAVAYANRGILFQQLKRHEEALASFDEAIAIEPNFTMAHGNRGAALQALERYEEALVSFDRVIALEPGSAKAYYNRGAALKELVRFEEAIASYGKAISLKPDYVEAYSNRGYLFYQLERLNEALADFGKAIELKPDFAVAYANSGGALRRLRRHGEAAARYQKALTLDPHYSFAKGMCLHEKMMCCDWSGIDVMIEEIGNEIALGKASAEPFGWQGLSSSPGSLKLCAEVYSKEKYPAITQGFSRITRAERTKIRLGYLSGEFRNQATSHLITSVLQCHDKSLFEIFLIDNGWDDQSETRKRIGRTADKIVNIRRLDDRAAVSLIQGDEIDILINLNGYFGEERTGVFAHRCAPIQVNYLGFPGTMGASYMDYIIADRYVIPENHRIFYTEKVVYLPHCYQANDNKKEISDHAHTRAEARLPEEAVVFCCFNNVYKITPERFDIWMRILRQVEGSVLWLLDIETAIGNLRKEASLRGIDPDRLVFAPYVSLPEHLARHRLADLFLDTLPCNAHTTASDALWAGLPVLTQAGGTFAGRVAASLLTAIGLPELITGTSEAYEALAIELATNPRKLAVIKDKLAANRLTAPLFNSELFAKHIEAAYTAMYHRHRASQPPGHIYVEA